MADKKNPFLELLPPTTDYVTYLTFIEHNLTEEHLPVLHQVLQDSELTINIGWVSRFFIIQSFCVFFIHMISEPAEVVQHFRIIVDSWISWRIVSLVTVLIFLRKIGMVL